MCQLHGLEVWGDFACFTRPELKVERFSYPVITPSAARGIFDAIYAKPIEFRWQVRRIEVLAPPSFIALRRNEVKNKASDSAIRRARDRSDPFLEPIYADEPAESTGRTQRQTMALKDVRYRLWAEIRAWPSFPADRASLDVQFQRRARTGKCFYQPYFGCREFPAYFSLVDENALGAPPVALDLEIGWMVYVVFDLSTQGSSLSRPLVSLFNARLDRGVLDVPEFGSELVRKAGSPC